MGERYGVGIIGVGRRGFDLARTIVSQRGSGNLELRALHNRTASRAEEARGRLRAGVGGFEAQREITVHSSYEALIGDPDVDLVMICTPQYAHREPAIAAVRAGKKVSLDKPLAHNLEDALAIHRAQEETSNPIIMSFTRRFEAPWIRAHRLIHEDGVIGPVRMVLVRNVIPYHIYFHTWHRRLEWSGGALADKMSHVFDVFTWFAGGLPEALSAMGGQAVFTPDPDAPERCSECDRECPYRAAPPGVARRPDAMVTDHGSRQHETDLIRRDDTCVWYPGADINDHGVVSMEYDNGVKASLFWSLFGPDSDDQETLEVVGDRGRLRLERQTGLIDMITDYGKHHEVMDLRSGESERSHFGADNQYVRELSRFCGAAPPPVTADDGLLAARLVEAAHRSIRNDGERVAMEEVPGG